MFRRALATGTALLALACVTLAIPPASAAPAGTTAGVADAGRMILAIRTPRQRTRCLDADVSTPIRNGTRVQVWDCNNQPQQDWYWDDLGRLQNGKDRRFCLDLDLRTGANNPGILQLWGCNPEPQQNWRWSNGGNGGKLWSNGRFQNKCVDADWNRADENGGPVQGWDCFLVFPAHWNQNWFDPRI